MKALYGFRGLFEQDPQQRGQQPFAAPLEVVDELEEV